MSVDVSVLMITYNHEAFISEAIEGVIMQKTDFNYELIIADDCSDDNTPNIVRRYALENKNVIKPILRTQNLGANKNWIEALNLCTGKYIAICEGDDFWTDPYKLQKQIDFLEANKDYGLVHTGCEYLFNNQHQPIQDFDKVQAGFVFENLLCKDFFISTLTVCVRKDYLMEWYKTLEKEMLTRKWKMGDFPLWLEGSLHTKFGFLPDITAHYRIVPESASHSLDTKKNFEFFQSTFDIINYFVARENVNIKTIEKINIQYNRLLLIYAFSHHNSTLGKQAYSNLKRYKVTLSQKEHTYYWGSKNHLQWFIIKVFYKVKRIFFGILKLG